MLETRRGSPSTCFSCKKLNDTTFLITEDDRYEEKPFIYVKIYEHPKLLVISDTGCGGNTSSGSSDTLRSFIETYPVPHNNHKPLNPRLDGGEPCSKYLIICTHCHYDHILGIPSFEDSSPVILASKHGKSFIEKDLPEHSLCKYMDVRTPDYKVSYWATDMEGLVFEGKPLGIHVLHTPGHTPDELAWYDEDARHLFVGDSFYNRLAEDETHAQAIIFPPQGNLVHYVQSLEKMQLFVREKNKEQSRAAVRLGCGHTTSSVDAESMLLDINQYFWDVLGGKIPVKKSMEKEGILLDLFQEDGSPRFSLQVPRLLVDRAREHFKFGPSPALNPAIL